MTFRQIIQQAIRDFILNLLTANVVSDIATNGLTAADQAVIDTYLDQTSP